MTNAESGSRDDSRQKKPGRRDPGLVLLKWRLHLVAALLVFGAGAWMIDHTAVVVPGLVGSLGLLVTTVAVAWAALQAGAPRRVLAMVQLVADVVIVALAGRSG